MCWEVLPTPEAAEQSQGNSRCGPAGKGGGDTPSTHSSTLANSNFKWDIVEINQQVKSYFQKIQSSGGFSDKYPHFVQTQTVDTVY